MIIDQYNDDDVGPLFKNLIAGARDNMKQKDDDFIMIIVGATGSGKSNLGLWTQSIVIDTPRIEQIALTRQDLARSLKAASESPMGDRYVQYDEGKLNRRDWMGNWSKELLELYHDIRGLRIFHVWCSAMPNLLEREFIKERVNMVCFITDKAIGRPRHFIVFTKNDILKFLDQNDTLSMDTLKKFGKRHATLQSWFRPYHGPLVGDYAQKKVNRMEMVVEKFYKSWGTDELSPPQVAEKFDVSANTVRSWLDDPRLKDGKDYLTSAVGKRIVTPEGLAKLREFHEFRKQNQGSLLTELASEVPSRLTYDTAPKRGEGPVDDDKERVLL